MAQKRSVDIKITFDDKGAVRSIDTLDTKIDNLGGTTGRIGKSVSGLGFALKGVLAIGVSAYFAKAAKDAIEFERAMANVSTLVDTSTVSMKGFERQILGLSGHLGSATDLSRGLYQALSAGADPAQAMTLVADAAKFGTAALTDTFTAVDVLTTVINAYGKETSEAAAVSDILFEIIKQGKTNGQDLAATMGQVIPTAAALNVGLEELGAAIATLTKGGISTAETMTALNATMMAFLSPTSEASKTARRLGVDTSVTALQSKGLAAVLRDVAKAADGDVAATTALFGNVRALKGVLALTGSQAEEFERILGEMYDTTGNVNEAFEKQTNTLGAQLTAVWNNLSSLVIRITNEWDGLLSVLKSINETLEMQNSLGAGIAGLWAEIGAKGAEAEVKRLQYLVASRHTSEELRKHYAVQLGMAAEELREYTDLWNDAIVAKYGLTKALSRRGFDPESPLPRLASADAAKKRAEEAVDAAAAAAKARAEPIPFPFKLDFDVSQMMSDAANLGSDVGRVIKENILKQNPYEIPGDLGERALLGYLETDEYRGERRRVGDLGIADSYGGGVALPGYATGAGAMPGDMTSIDAIVPDSDKLGNLTLTLGEIKDLTSGISIGAVDAADAIRAMFSEETLANAELGLNSLADYLDGLDRTKEQIANFGALFQQGFQLMAAGVRQGGLALVAALTQVSGMILTKIGGMLVSQGIAEVVAGMSPMIPRPDWIIHGKKMIAVGGGMMVGGQIASVAGGGMGTVAGATGRGGPPGSVFNPVNTQQSPNDIGPTIIDLSASGQSEQTAQLNNTIRRLESKIIEMTPGNVVAVAADNGLAPYMAPSDLNTIQQETYDEPIVR
jgi:TP901 family phage tail tape measure protein